MTNQRKLFFPVLSLLVLVAIATTFLFTRNNSHSKPNGYSIGVVLSLTGRGGTYGQRALYGMQLAADELNSKEPFRSRPIQLIIEDSQSSAQQSLSAFRKLIDVDKISIAIGFVLSDEVLTCAPVANENKVVILSTAAGSDDIKNAGDFIFRNRESATLQSEAIAQACVEHFGFREVSILYSNAANGISYRDSFRNALQRLGGTVPIAVGYNEGKTDYRLEIEHLRARSPLAIYLAGLDQELGLILKQAHEVGFNPQFFASAGAISQKLLEVAGAGAEGLVCGSAPFNVTSEDMRVRAFATAFRTQFGETPDFIAANSYDAVYMLAEIFKSDTRDAEGIKTALYAIRDFPGVGGRTTFDKYGEVAKPIELVIVRNGRFVPLEGR